MRVSALGSWRMPLDDDGFPVNPVAGIGDLESVDADTDIDWAISQGSGGGGGIWGSILPGIINTTGNILTARYGVPPAGTVITTPNAQVIRQPAGYPATAAVANFGVGGNLGTPLMIGGLILAAAFLFKRN